ncbi:enolase C-terminal domain-like protein [Aspergillus homomorphus CBS 101889]|uniref:Enolase C-terminal domain-like protein n=1 Tax=Aspergillus homomorphus (strain CBS 101889) TaxID=1450537 RepID=A0A395HJ80_ASPHC|nr:enolase C-terminal domain-like protein [Aspergillus homomorphus CBS 101889]RAL06958.1 enolase C-terminal domain-like protein [Aspergillus homomorphus CBS 101889]
MPFSEYAFSDGCFPTSPLAPIQAWNCNKYEGCIPITDADGNNGWGEASLEGHTEAVEGCLDAFTARFQGIDANAIEHIWQNGYRMGFYRGGPVLMSALARIDIALWDLNGEEPSPVPQPCAKLRLNVHPLLARRLGLPIYELFGGKVRDQLRVYALIGGGRPGDVEAQARARITQERLKTVKSPGLDAEVDFHDRVHKAIALQLAHKLARSIAVLSKLVPIPIALGERLHSRWDIKPFLESASVSILQPDICHVGGISELRRMATMAETYDVALAPQCPLGPIALAANLQVDAVLANFIGTYVKNAEVWTGKGGLIRLMDGPELGIELDEMKIRAAAVDAVAWRSPSFQGLGREW